MPIKQKWCPLCTWRQYLCGWSGSPPGSCNPAIKWTNQQISLEEVKTQNRWQKDSRRTKCSEDSSKDFFRFLYQQTEEFLILYYLHLFLLIMKQQITSYKVEPFCRLILLSNYVFSKSKMASLFLQCTESFPFHLSQVNFAAAQTWLRTENADYYVIIILWRIFPSKARVAKR